MVPHTRRRLLLVAGGALAGTGCLSRGSTPDLVGTDGMDVSFEVVPPRSVPPTDAARDDDGPNDPVVSFESDRIVVTGVVGVGSSKCKEAVLESVTYDEEEGTLRTVVAAGKSDEHPDRKLLGGSCPDDYSYDWYRLVLSRSDEAVREVTADERDTGGTETSLTVSNPASE